MSNRDWADSEIRLLERVINYVIQNSEFTSGRQLQRKGGIFFEFAKFQRKSVWLPNREVLTLLGSNRPDDLGEVLLDRLV